MSAPISNAPNAESGIVLFPETGRLRELNDAQARQFGMVVNAHIAEDGAAHLGTAHAVGYDPQIAVDLQQLHFRDGYATRFNESDKAQERILLDEMGRRIQSELNQQGLAANGLANALVLRRLDIILPSTVRKEATNALAHSLSYLAVDTTYHPFPQLWSANEEGITALTPSTSVSYRHPLHASKLGVKEHRIESRQIFTSDVLLQAAVKERVTYNLPLEDEQLVATSQGFQTVSHRRQLASFTATYPIPTEAGDVVVAELNKLDTRNEQRLKEYEDKTNAADSDGAVIDLDLGSAHDGYRDDTYSRRRELARLIDPQHDPAWAENLN